MKVNIDFVIFFYYLNIIQILLAKHRMEIIYSTNKNQIIILVETR